MSVVPVWSLLPGPIDFVYAIVGDLRDGHFVIAGIPHEYARDVAVEVAEASKREQLGVWSTVGIDEARMASADALIRTHGTENRSGSGIIWVNAIDNEVATSWINYANEFASKDITPKVCVAVPTSCARKCKEEKHLRRRLWLDFVTSTDSRVLVERHCRQGRYSRVQMELKCELVTKLAGSNLSSAERMATGKLSKLFDIKTHRKEDVWAAQVAVLLPFVDKERRRILKQYPGCWRVPRFRQEEDLEVGEMWMQAQQSRVLEQEKRRLEWLRRVRNDLAHNKVISWGTFMSAITLKFADFAN